MAAPAAQCGRKQVQSLIKKKYVCDSLKGAIFGSAGILLRIPYHISNVNDYLINIDIVALTFTCLQVGF